MFLRAMVATDKCPPGCLRSTSFGNMHWALHLVRPYGTSPRFLFCKQGLPRESSPGLRTPGASIMPPDRAAVPHAHELWHVNHGLRSHHGQVRAAPGIDPGTSRTLSEKHATRPSSQMLVWPVRTFALTVALPAEGARVERPTALRLPPADSAGKSSGGHGLLRELNPGPLAP